MLLQSDSTRTAWGQRWLNWLLAGLLLVVVLVLVLAALRHPPHTPAPRADHLYFDLETTDGQDFVSGLHRVGGAQGQSDDHARSGQHSLHMPASGQVQYALNLPLPHLESGYSYEASVWRLRSPAQDGKLVVTSGEDQALYAEEGDALIREDDWEQLRIRWQVPYERSWDTLYLYVYSLGQANIYWDDLRIVRLPGRDTLDWQPPQLTIQLSDKAFQQLSDKRDKAWRKGLLHTTDEDWVSATLMTDTTNIPIRTRLKGDWLDHLSGEKWSFRIRTRSGYSWNGMSSFSLHTPAARYHLHEWLLHQAWTSADVLTTRYDLARLHRNQRDLGLYAWEEHFDKQLVESRRRREGPLLKLDDSAFWTARQIEWDQYGYQRTDPEHPAAQSHLARVSAFRASAWQDTPERQATLRRAISLLEGVISGQLIPSEVYDLTRMADFYALSDVFSTNHNLVWHNQRFYYNALQDRLEPIGYDAFGGGEARQYTLSGSVPHADDPLAGIWQDRAFLRQYIRALDKYSSTQWWDTFTRDQQAGWFRRLPWIQAEFPAYDAQLDDFFRQAQYVRTLLYPQQDFSIRAYRDASGQVWVANLHTLPLEIVGYGAQAYHPTQKPESAIWLRGRPARQLEQRLRRDTVVSDMASLRFIEQAVMQQQRVADYEPVRVDADMRHVFFRLPGLDSVFTAVIHKGEVPDRPRHPTLARTAQWPDSSQAYRMGQQLIFLPEKITLTEDVHIPAGYEVIFPAGMTMQIPEGVLLSSESAVQSRGRADLPVRIEGAGSVYVMADTTPSSWRYTVVDGLGPPQRQGWQLTGGVTFYATEARFEHCHWRNSLGEDALNVVRSQVALAHCSFAHTRFDALDSDFCTLSLDHARFVQCGNDAIDCSGSIVTLDNIYIDGCGDKGLSAGEESDVNWLSGHIANANIAMAAKDLSTLRVQDVALSDCRQGFMAYQKKPAYGGARLLVEAYQARRVDRLYASGPDSQIQLPPQNQ